MLINLSFFFNEIFQINLNILQHADLMHIKFPWYIFKHCSLITFKTQEISWTWLCMWHNVPVLSPGLARGNSKACGPLMFHLQWMQFLFPNYWITEASILPLKLYPSPMLLFKPRAHKAIHSALKVSLLPTSTILEGE